MKWPDRHTNLRGRWQNGGSRKNIGGSGIFFSMLWEPCKERLKFNRTINKKKGASLKI